MKGPLVRATLEGRKTQTRRPLPDVFNSPPDLIYGWLPPGEWKIFGAVMERWGAQWRGTYPSQVLCPLGRTGDRLWVRETWDWRDWQSMANRKVRIAYAADGAQVDTIAPCDWNPVVYNAARWHPSIHMPRWASRITLPLVSVRVERVQDITDEDAEAEGVEPIEGSYREGFRAMWQDIYATWDANPWVWVAEWKEIEVSR